MLPRRPAPVMFLVPLIRFHSHTRLPFVVCVVMVVSRLHAFFKSSVIVLIAHASICFGHRHANRKTGFNSCIAALRVSESMQSLKFALGKYTLQTPMASNNVCTSPDTCRRRRCLLSTRRANSDVALQQKIGTGSCCRLHHHVIVALLGGLTKVHMNIDTLASASRRAATWL